MAIWKEKIWLLDKAIALYKLLFLLLGVFLAMISHKYD